MSRKRSGQDFASHVMGGEHLVDAPEIKTEGDELTIRQLGDFSRTSCRGGHDKLEIKLGHSGDYHPLASYGRYVIRVPAGAKVHIGGGVVAGSIGDVGELDVGQDSCGDLKVGEVAGKAEAAVNGSGDIVVGSIGGGLRAAVNGSGDIKVGAIKGDLHVGINGSGDVVAASLEGDIDAAIRGSGDVTVHGGHASAVKASIMGSGDVRFEGVAADVDLSAFGSGDVYVAQATGTVKKASFGSGDVRIGKN